MATKLASPCGVPRCRKAAERSGLCGAHLRAYEASPDRRAAKRFYGTLAWRQLRRFILRRDPICRDPSGCIEPSTEADHIVPRRQGGTDDPSNLRGLCKRHHSRKTLREMGRIEISEELYIQYAAQGSLCRREIR